MTEEMRHAAAQQAEKQEQNEEEIKDDAA
jgi:hypothetical protein